MYIYDQNCARITACNETQEFWSSCRAIMPPFGYICFEKWLALDLKFMELHDEMTVEIFLLRDLNLIGIGQIRI